VSIIIGDHHKTVTFSSLNELVKTIIPVKFNRNSQSKLLNITFMPPFNPTLASSYDRKTGLFQFENAPVYELVNIAFAITDKGSNDPNTFNLDNKYYKEVLEYFSPHRNHPLIEMINKIYYPTSSEYRMYRESAYNYSFQNDRIEITGPYKNFEEGNTVLDHKALWEDFATKSNFQEFYKKHQPFYTHVVKNAEELLPVGKMWQWCEKKFPDRYNTYRIIISPLVNGFHSTQNITSKDFRECIMFICDSENFDRMRYKQKEIEILYGGLLFTEIDHNYINPISDKYESELDKIFTKDGWVTKGSQAEGYQNGTGFFNEYLTHAVYLLYVEDNYSPEELTIALKDRTDLMKWRGFPHFEKFYKELKSLYSDQKINKDLTLLYPELIKWASQQ
jgi:hypothetical protein